MTEEGFVDRALVHHLSRACRLGSQRKGDQRCRFRRRSCAARAAQSRLVLEFQREPPDLRGHAGSDPHRYVRGFCLVDPVLRHDDTVTPPKPSRCGGNNKRVAPGRRLAPLSGSFRSRPEDAKIVGSIDEAETFVVRLYLKNPAVRAHAPGSAADLAALARPTTRRALARRRAAEYAPVVAVIKKFAKKNGSPFNASRPIAVA